MSDTKLLKEIFGEETARRLARANAYEWEDIRSALTESYEDWEMDPPDSSPLPPRPNCRVALCDDSLTVVKKAKHEYQLENEKEAITKSLRFGLSDVSYRWGAEVQQLNQIDRAASITSEYSYSDDFTQSFLSESDSITIPGRQPANRRSTQVRTLWYEKHIASSLSENLGIPMTDIFRCGILVAGRELGRLGELAPPQDKKLQELIQRIDQQFQRQVNQSEQLIFGAITRAAITDYGVEMIAELQSSCPRVWDNYQSAHRAMVETIGYG